MKKSSQFLKKNQLITIEFIGIVSKKLKKKKITGVCTKIKNSKTAKTITIKVIILREPVSFTFILNSPLILKIERYFS